jgi:hypothetical protein
VVLAFYDFDRSGEDACASLREKLTRFGGELGVPVEFHSVALDVEQVTGMGLPTRPAKRMTPADRRWPWGFAAELDAIPPDSLRGMVRDAIEHFLPRHDLERLKDIEDEERQSLYGFLGAI